MADEKTAARKGYEAKRAAILAEIERLRGKIELLDELIAEEGQREHPAPSALSKTARNIDTSKPIPFATALKNEIKQRSDYACADDLAEAMEQSGGYKPPGRPLSQAISSLLSQMRTRKTKGFDFIDGEVNGRKRLMVRPSGE